MSFAARYSRVLDAVTNGMAVVAGSLLVFQVVSVTVDVTLRYFFDAPIRGVIAFNEWSLLYIAFLGAPWLQRRGGHISVDIFTELGGPRVRVVSTIFGTLLGILSCLVLIYFGSIVTYEKYANEIYDYFKLRSVPVWPVYLVIPVGSAIWLLQLLRDLWRSVATASPTQRTHEEL